MDGAGTFLKVKFGVPETVSLCSMTTLISPNERAAQRRKTATVRRRTSFDLALFALGFWTKGIGKATRCNFPPNWLCKGIGDHMKTDILGDTIICRVLNK